MDAKSLLKVVAEKVTPEDARKIMGRIGVAVLVGAQWSRFDGENGVMEAETGGVTPSVSLGQIAGVRILTEAEMKSFGKSPVVTSGGTTAAATAQNHPPVARVVPLDSVKDSAGGAFRPPDPARAETHGLSADPQAKTATVNIPDAKNLAKSQTPPVEAKTPEVKTPGLSADAKTADAKK